MPVEIVIDTSQIDQMLERLKEVPYAFQRAVYPAVSEVMQGVRNDLAEYLTSDVPISSKSALGAIKLSPPKSYGQAVIGSVSVRSSMLPLIYYDVLPQAITARQGLSPKAWPDFSFSLRRGERRAGRSRVLGIGLPFIARMPNGHLGVYYRTETQMKQAYGPTVQYHVATPEAESLFTERAQSQFPEILARYADQALAEFGGGA